MPTFAYEGKTASGEVKKGKIEAHDANSARSQLRRMNINPTTVKEKKGLNDIVLFAPKVTTRDLVIFTRQFATMIDSGLPLVQCLDIQAKQAENPTFRTELATIKESVESGSTFADALKRFPGTFDDLYQNMVAAGEVGGILDTILNRLAAYLEKSDKLKRQIKSAMMYPLITVFVSIVVVGVLLIFVVPTFETMFADMGAELPQMTQIVVGMSRWIQAYFLYVFIGAVAFFWTFKWFYGTERGNIIIDKVMLKLPVFGDLLTKVGVARFCRTLGTMLSSGVAILEALDICSRTSGNKTIEHAIVNVRAAISEGRNIAESKVFPDMVCQMISVGEATGALDVMLNKVADFYEDEVDQAVEGLTSMLEPMIMVFLGVIIGGLVISMYLPIFSMANGI
jgi:type IV pilus assembly protein PilC